MSKPNVDEGKSVKKYSIDSDDWDDLGDDEYESDAPGKFDRSKRKINGEAKRLYERMQENLRLKALIYGDLGY